MNTAHPVDEFFSSEDVANFAVENESPPLATKPLRVLIKRCGNVHLALSIGVGQTAVGPLMHFSRDTSMSCELGSVIDEKNAEGFSFQAFLKPDDDRSARIILLEGPMNRDNGDSNFTLDLSILRNRCGNLGLRCSSRTGCESLESALAVLKWVAGPNDRISLLTERTHRSRRIQRTIECFNAAYNHEMYPNRKADDGGEDASSFKLLPKTPSAHKAKSDEPITAESLLNLPSAKVREGENVFDYAHRVLGSLIPIRRPDFPKRIRSVYEREHRPVRILSLCSGAAGIERRMIADAGCPVEITLLDLNEKLMRKAAAVLSPIRLTSAIMT